MPYADPAKRRECNRRWMRQWRAEQPEKARAALERWRGKNPTYRREYYWLTENNRAKDLLRAAVRGVLVHRKSNRDWDKDAKLRLILGCSKAAFRSHIEAQFEPGMSWANYGRGGWEIDHVKPCRDFDLMDPDQIVACFHYTNLRPLWSIDNQRRTRKE